jgi:hypothetical protein
MTNLDAELRDLQRRIDELEHARQVSNLPRYSRRLGSLYRKRSALTVRLAAVKEAVSAQAV